MRALRGVANAALRRAAHVLSPSAYLRELALGWGLDPARVIVVPEPGPAVAGAPPRESCAPARRRRHVLAFAGRLTDAEGARCRARRGRATCRACRCSSPATGRSAGARARRARARSRRPRAVPRRRLARRRARLFRAADAALLSSAWENFPHTVVESLAVGTPVIATAVGGVPEVVRDGVNGLLVPPADAGRAAAAIARFFDDPALRTAACGPRPRRRSPHLAEEPLLRADRSAARGGCRAMRRLLMAGRTRYALPLSPRSRSGSSTRSRRSSTCACSPPRRGARRRRRALPPRPSRSPVLDGPLFYAALPVPRRARAAAAPARRRARPGRAGTALALLGRRLAGAASR